MTFKFDFIVSKQFFHWGPAQLSGEFVNEVLDTYYGYQSGVLPDLRALTDATREIMLKADSYRETKGKYFDYWEGILNGMEDKDEWKALKLSVSDRYYPMAFNDVERLLRLLRLSYVNSECPRKQLVHYAKEVW